MVNEDLVAEAEAQVKQRNVALAQFAKKAEAQAAKIAENAWVSPLDSYHLSAGFGAASYLWSHLHTGQDLGAPIGSPIHSIANGVVTETGYDGSYGNKTVVTLDDGTEIWYCHQTSYLVERRRRGPGRRDDRHRGLDRQQHRPAPPHRGPPRRRRPRGPHGGLPRARHHALS